MCLRLLRKPVLIVSILWLLSSTGVTQTLETSESDSLQSDSTLSIFNFTETIADTTKQPGSFKPWLLPIGIAAVTGSVIFLLFSVRSR